MKAMVFKTQEEAEAAQAKVLEFFEIRDPKAEVSPPTKWSTPQRRTDTGEWWITAPGTAMLDKHSADIVEAKGKVETGSDVWFASVKAQKELIK